MCVKTKPCPFCGGASKMELTKDFKGSGGLKGLVIFVEHEQNCIIHEQSEFCYGFINFNTGSEVGKIALNSLEEDFARQWNRRVK